MVIRSKSFLSMVISTCLFLSSSGQDSYDTNRFFRKEEITVVITDSGLGGLSVMNDLSIKMEKSGCFRQVNLIFVNALFDASTGYNSLRSRDDKINTLNKVLTGINKRYSPDVILIACNTLSVLYPETEFVKKSGVPVIGIIEAGVRLINDKLKEYPESSVIIFGTETTIEEESHKKALLSQNIDEKRIITKACPQLQSYVEQDPSGEETEMLISVYLNEALENSPVIKGPVFLSLNCSHFGYSEELWKKAMENSKYKSGGVLNPNYSMGDFLVKEEYMKRFPDTKISYQVVSKVELINEKPMFNLFYSKSPDLARALENYKIISDLF